MPIPDTLFFGVHETSSFDFSVRGDASLLPDVQENPHVSLQLKARYINRLKNSHRALSTRPGHRAAGPWGRSLRLRRGGPGCGLRPTEASPGASASARTRVTAPTRAPPTPGPSPRGQLAPVPALRPACRADEDAAAVAGHSSRSQAHGPRQAALPICALLADRSPRSSNKNVFTWVIIKLNLVSWL